MNLFLICFFIFHQCNFGSPEGKWFYCFFFLAEYDFNLDNLEYLFQIEQLIAYEGKVLLCNYILYLELFVVVFQLLCHIQLFATSWISAFQASLSFTISQSLLRLMFIELMMPSNHLLILCPLPPSPPAFYISQHYGIFQWIGISRQMPKILELQNYFTSIQFYM